MFINTSASSFNSISLLNTSEKSKKYFPDFSSSLNIS